MTLATGSVLAARCAALSTIAGGGTATSVARSARGPESRPLFLAATNENAATWRGDGVKHNKNGKVIGAKYHALPPQRMF